MKINKLEVLLKVGLCKIFRKNNDLQAKSLKKIAICKKVYCIFNSFLETIVVNA